MEAEIEHDEGGFTAPCWCGAKRGWCSTADLDSTCGGMGTLYCYCGGDLCVCHNHGEVECDGCEDCEGDSDDDDDFYDDDY
jgi:hypothetical protein